MAPASHLAAIESGPDGADELSTDKRFDDAILQRIRIGKVRRAGAAPAFIRRVFDVVD